MLGYVLPDKGELKLREYEIYSGYYCGICKYIGKNFGHLPRMALSYDAAFLALLLACIDETPDTPSSEHCAVHHIKYKTIVRNTAIEYSGDVMLILAWFKLLDDARDEGKTYAKAITAVLKNRYDKLSRKHPHLCSRIELHLHQLTELEKEKCSSIDKAAEAFSLIMSDIFTEGLSCIYDNSADLSNIHETFAKIGYHMGKWIYLIDAVDDIEENLKSDSYNPLLYRFEYDPDSETADEFRKRIDEDLRFNLFSYLAAVGEEVDKLDIRKNSGIIENIVYFGLNRKTEDVLLRRPSERKLFPSRDPQEV